MVPLPRWIVSLKVSTTLLPTLTPVLSSAGLKLTTARYYTPSGRSIQAKGIEPDIYVDDGRESLSQIREANLENHLDTGKKESSAARAVETLKRANADAAKPQAKSPGTEAQPAAPQGSRAAPEVAAESPPSRRAFF